VGHISKHAACAPALPLGSLHVAAACVFTACCQEFRVSKPPCVPKWFPLLAWAQHIILFTLLLLSSWRYLSWSVVAAPALAGSAPAVEGSRGPAVLNTAKAGAQLSEAGSGDLKVEPTEPQRLSQDE
jgi:hypothetical protein